MSLNIHDVGISQQIAGLVLGNGTDAYIIMLPDETFVGTPATLFLDTEQWQELLDQMDTVAVEVLSRKADGTIVKAIARKSQRVIEANMSWKVFFRDGYRCRYCGRSGIPLTVDHLVLWEEGGPTTEDNLVACCRKCNKVRGNMQYADWIKSDYYLRVSVVLPLDYARANLDLLDTLPGIRRVYHQASR